MHKKLFGSKCIILDHPGTTLNISMISNTPTILFWEEKYFPLEDKAAQILKEFKLNSMFFDDEKKLSKFLKNTNISDWWASNRVQDLRKYFMNNYSYTTPNWRRDWVNYLKDL